MEKNSPVEPRPQLTFSPRDRLLVIAVHPDDETLAAGGLLQRARTAGAAVRVLFATDGENNPWPQRLLERRWRLAAPDRARWGERRRAEALGALRQLGFTPESARFMGLPDLGLTRALLKADQRVVTSLVSAFAEFGPTVVVYPSGADLHPDHNALHVLVRLALKSPRAVGPGSRPVREWHYLVHGRDGRADGCRATLALRPAEQLAKREAVLCHASQLVLSRRRFLAYAGPEEMFFGRAGKGDGASAPAHPAQGVTCRDQRLLVRFPRTPAGRSPSRWATLWLAMESGRVGSLRWSLPLSVGSLPVRDETTGVQLGAATGRLTATALEITLPVAEGLWPMERVSLKVHRPTVFYDHAGWREFDLGVAPVHRPRQLMDRTARLAKIAFRETGSLVPDEV